jgi:N-acetylglucosamine-6-phosphate deacetylase
MATSELLAWHYQWRAPVRVRWAHGVITALERSATAPASEVWIAPALVDLQINGYAGIDFQRGPLGEPELDRAAHGLQAAGCGRFLLTLVTDQWETMLERLRHLVAIRRRSAALAAVIGGWHIEGPFLSDVPGFCGAHDARFMTDPAPAHLQQIREIVGADPVLLTLAPERRGALEFIRLAAQFGMRISLGHTDASADVLDLACRAGATGFTHLGNACPQALDRHDNILWRVLDNNCLTVSLIPDGFHVSPPLFRLVHRVLPEARIYYTTDAVTPAGAPSGRYTVGRHDVEVGPDQVVRQPGQSNYAGSGLRPIDGVWRAAQMLGRPWQAVWDFFSRHPARLMGWKHDLEIGAPATFCVLEATDASINVLQTAVDGQMGRGGGVQSHGAKPIR